MIEAQCPLCSIPLQHQPVGQDTNHACSIQKVTFQDGLQGMIPSGDQGIDALAFPYHRLQYRFSQGLVKLSAAWVTILFQRPAAGDEERMPQDYRVDFGGGHGAVLG